MMKAPTFWDQTDVLMIVIVTAAEDVLLTVTVENVCTWPIYIQASLTAKIVLHVMQPVSLVKDQRTLTVQLVQMETSC
jgi:hypothetical protein